MTEPDHEAARQWALSMIDNCNERTILPKSLNLGRAYLALDGAEKRREGDYLDCLEKARVAKAAGVTKEPGWYWAKPSDAENWQVGRVLNYESISGPACMVFSGVATLPVAEVYAWGPKLEPPTGEQL